MTTHDARNLTDGRWQEAQSGATATSRDPADGSDLGRYPASGKAGADAAIDAARRAFDQPGWSQSPRLRQMDVVLFEACSSTALAGVEDTAAGDPSGRIGIIVPSAPVGCNHLAAEWASPWIA